MEVYIIGKRWMWKAQHLTGHREINQLHVPVGTPVKLLISSEDVIHSYYIPAFRQKMDAVPGKTTTMWFEATKAGTYQLFCAEYCGTQHSGMIGKVTAMEPREYQQWLAAGAPAGTLTATGEQQFATLGCVTCHHEDGKGRGPSLVGVFGKPQQMANGSTVTADEAYLRESILNPQAKMVQGYQPLMPTYQGQISEDCHRRAAGVHQVAREAGRRARRSHHRRRRRPRGHPLGHGPCTTSEPTNSTRPPRPRCRPCTT